MKRSLFAAVLSLVVALGVMPDVSQAKRLGGGKSFGMQRQAPAKAAPQNPPAQPAATPAPAAPVAGVPATPAAATAAAAAPAKRSWLGPVAGLAAGLGLAALFSALGLGEGLATFVMLLLLGLAALVVVRLVLSRMRGGLQPAMAGAPGGTTPGVEPRVATRQALQPDAPQERAVPASPAGTLDTTDVSVTGAPLRALRVGEAFDASGLLAAAGERRAPALPEGFDQPAFERVAKMIFIRLQAANDKGDLDDLREFTTPEVFAALRVDLLERNGAAQHTDVERVDAHLFEFAEEPGRQIASVRFTGQVREEREGPATAFDEIWHLVKPLDETRSWAIAGIQQAH